MASHVITPKPLKLPKVEIVNKADGRAIFIDDHELPAVVANTLEITDWHDRFRVTFTVMADSVQYKNHDDD